MNATTLSYPQAPAAQEPALAGVVLPDAVRRLLTGRQNVSPKRLVEPGPSEAQREVMLEMAGAAPDHGVLTPWRFVIVPAQQRERLAEVYALALRERDPVALPMQLEAARAKAYRAPLLMLAILCAGAAGSPVPTIERVISLGAAIQNLLLAAHALGFGSGLVSGRAMASEPMRRLFALAADERAVCFVNVGTVREARPPRARPAVSSYCSSLP